MPNFEQGDVVRVPFPYTDRDARQGRPALVVSNGVLGDGVVLLWVVMITSAANRPWVGDIPVVQEHSKVGLPVPSVIRSTKIATIEARRADRLGRLPSALWEQVANALRTHLGFSPAGM